ncbi:MAG: aspartate aminotransferase family protein [Promethearchaeota archaeon]
MFIQEELELYKKNRMKSKSLWEKALRVLPGGISHTIRTFNLNLIGGFPIFIESANGPFLKDIDGNEYLDCWNGHFAMILGHNHPIIQQEIKDHLSKGWHFGTLTKYQVELADTIIQNNPGIEMMRFCVTGTEATMYATRLARAYTGKRLIAKAKLGWHGASDSLYYSVGSLINGQTSPGLLDSEKAGVLTFEINNDGIFDQIKRNKNNLAAIILEPVLGGGGGFPVEIEFLKRLREETMDNNILLIFDEIITGYRFMNGLYQNKLNIIPDLTTMGKIIGGGLPIGAIGGREDIIERSSPLEDDQVLIGGGTFSGYPLSMVAGLKTIEILKKSQQEYDRINKEGDQLLKNFDRFFTENKLPIKAVGHKSIIMLHVLKKWIENPSIKQIIEFTHKKRESLLHLALFNRNISGLHGLGSLSMAQKKEHFTKIQNVIENIGQPVSQAQFNL